uniref:Protein kinase domain-containing protein n=2 Tax=Hemiselmis andersenii TaxID=464988 RepID=A0A7S1H826_HEMAN|mmetsp:Transcript_41421/g.101074  ORF Transcript_41421/g.101074 Transcript_41421/m.101074 type:complete len:378 (+) Transcript_41421:2-1135(+)
MARPPLSLALCLLCVGFSSAFSPPAALFTAQKRQGRADTWRMLIIQAQPPKFSSKDVSANWQQPDAQGTFGKVYFGKQGMMGMGGQVVVKVPVNNAVNKKFAASIFQTEKAVNEKLARTPNPRVAKYLGDIGFQPGDLPGDLENIGLMFKREAGESMEDMLLDGKDLSGKLGARDGGLAKPDLCTRVMGELLVACAQMHDVGVIHRDIKPENIIVTGGGEPLKLIDFGSSCDISTGMGVNDISLDPTYAPPEKRIQGQQAGKYDVYCVAMTGLRCLLPSFSKDPRPGVNERAGQTSLMMEFGEVEFPRADCRFERWASGVRNGRGDPRLQDELEDLFAGGNEDLIRVLDGMLAKQVGARFEARRALAELGQPWAGKA